MRSNLLIEESSRLRRLSIRFLLSLSELEYQFRMVRTVKKEVYFCAHNSPQLLAHGQGTFHMLVHGADVLYGLLSMP